VLVDYLGLRPLFYFLICSSDQTPVKMTTTTKPAAWFWIVSGFALLWNLMGVMAYLSQVTMSEETFHELSQNEQDLITSVPTWATGAFALAVWGSLLACFTLLAKKKIATLLFIIGFAGALVQMFHAVFLSDSMDVYGPTGMIMPVLVLIIGLALILFSKKSTAKGWLS